MSESDIRLFIDSYLYHNQYENLSTLAKAQAHIHSACKVIFAIQIIPVLYSGYEKIKKFCEEVKCDNIEEASEKVLGRIAAEYAAKEAKP